MSREAAARDDLGVRARATGPPPKPGDAIAPATSTPHRTRKAPSLTTLVVGFVALIMGVVLANALRMLGGGVPVREDGTSAVAPPSGVPAGRVQEAGKAMLLSGVTGAPVGTSSAGERGEGSVQSRSPRSLTAPVKVFVAGSPRPSPVHTPSTPKLEPSRLVVSTRAPPPVKPTVHARNHAAPATAKLAPLLQHSPATPVDVVPPFRAAVHDEKTAAPATTITKEEEDVEEAEEREAGDASGGFFPDPQRGKHVQSKAAKNCERVLRAYGGAATGGVEEIEPRPILLPPPVVTEQYQAALPKSLRPVTAKNSVVRSGYAVADNADHPKLSYLQAAPLLLDPQHLLLADVFLTGSCIFAINTRDLSLASWFDADKLRIAYSVTHGTPHSGSGVFNFSASWRELHEPVSVGRLCKAGLREAQRVRIQFTYNGPLPVTEERIRDAAADGINTEAEPQLLSTPRTWTMLVQRVPARVPTQHAVTTLVGHNWRLLPAWLDYWRLLAGGQGAVKRVTFYLFFACHISTMARRPGGDVLLSLLATASDVVIVEWPFAFDSIREVPGTTNEFMRLQVIAQPLQANSAFYRWRSLHKWMVRFAALHQEGADLWSRALHRDMT